MPVKLCDHGKPVWYIRGANTLTHNRVGYNCIPCTLSNHYGGGVK